MKKQKEVRTLSSIMEESNAAMARDQRIAELESEVRAEEHVNSDSVGVHGLQTLLADFIVANRYDVNAKVILAKSLLVELAIQEYKSR